jgi:hypothetical protein
VEGSAERDAHNRLADPLSRGDVESSEERILAVGRAAIAARARLNALLQVCVSVVSVVFFTSLWVNGNRSAPS